MYNIVAYDDDTPQLVVSVGYTDKTSKTLTSNNYTTIITKKNHYSAIDDGFSSESTSILFGKPSNDVSRSKFSGKSDI